MWLTPEPLGLPGAFVVGGQARGDLRGAFQRLYCETELAGVLAHRRIVQVNLSRTAQPGAIRGLHYQRAPHAEMKLVRCVKGRVWDVAADLRPGSPTFRRWRAVELSPQNGRMMAVPEGCAHGFQALEPDSELLYLHTAAYAPEADAGVRFDDPDLAIDWPLPAGPLSPRDLTLPCLDDVLIGAAP